MFPHDKLDWNLGRLEKRLQDGDNDVTVRLAFAAACISKARFHGGSEVLYNEALTHARRVLHVEPGNPEALVLAALAMVLLDRAEPAERYLEEAKKTAADDPRLHVALAARAVQLGSPRDAVTSLEAAVRLAPESWEGHLLLGRLLARRNPPGTPGPDGGVQRQMERAQYHLVRALQLGPTPHEEPAALYDLSLLCLRTGRMADGQRLLQRLVDDDRYRGEARYHLGRVASRMGKHKKAILYYRQHLEESPEEGAEVWARIGACYLHESEPQKAREACNRALALDPGDIEARWILGAALLTEGEAGEAIRQFREILEIAPDHYDAFAELVRLRTHEVDLRWLRQAIRSEVAVYDRLPVQTSRLDHRTGRAIPIDPRAATRARIQVLLRGLGRVDQEVTHTALECLDLTTDEGLRFVLWEGILEQLARQRSARVAEGLAAAGGQFSTALGRDVLTLAHLLSEEQLVAGLGVGEEDLRRAAVDRHGPATDVVAHRQDIAAERQQARAWQALLLLGIASKRTTAARNLLVRWASDADEELKIAARAGLAMTGDVDAIASFESLGAPRSLAPLLRRAAAIADHPSGPEPAVLVSDRDDLVCATCGRRGGQVGHMITGRGIAVCNICAASVHERRAELTSRDPDVACALTGASLLDAEAIYVYQGVAISSTCIDQSLGHEEREAIAAWLAAQ
jgi:tetratricopeptide (TPR) repeat protein